MGLPISHAIPDTIFDVGLGILGGGGAGAWTGSSDARA